MNEFLDHIIWACDDLERGARRFEALTGVTPQYGGAHASGLTHNALVSLGPRSYLEILAPTGPPGGTDDAFSRLARTAGEPRVLTYCLRSARPLPELAQIAEAMGAPKAEVLKNGRTTPAGVKLQWQWAAPVFDRLGLAFHSSRLARLAASGGNRAGSLRHGETGSTSRLAIHSRANSSDALFQRWVRPSRPTRRRLGESGSELDTPLGAVSL